MTDDDAKALRLLPGLLLAGVVCAASLGIGIWAATDATIAARFDRIFAGLVAVGMAIRAVVSALSARRSLRERDWRALAVSVAACVVLAGLALLALAFAFPAETAAR